MSLIATGLLRYAIYLFIIKGIATALLLAPFIKTCHARYVPQGFFLMLINMTNITRQFDLFTMPPEILNLLAILQYERCHAQRLSHLEYIDKLGYVFS